MRLASKGGVQSAARSTVDALSVRFLCPFVLPDVRIWNLCVSLPSRLLCLPLASQPLLFTRHPTPPTHPFDWTADSRRHVVVPIPQGTPLFAHPHKSHIHSYLTSDFPSSNQSCQLSDRARSPVTALQWRSASSSRSTLPTRVIFVSSGRYGINLSRELYERELEVKPRFIMVMPHTNSWAPKSSGASIATIKCRTCSRSYSVSA
jgi:hypothetical protein